MTVFTHALATNNYGSNSIIVDSNPANGTHTTIQAALTAAAANQTIFIRPGTYTENITLASGKNLAANTCDAFTPNVTIVGTITVTSATTVSISGIQLKTNSAALLALTGSAASIVNINNCYLNCTNNTGITYSTSSGSSALFIMNCRGDLGTTGIGIYDQTSAGLLTIEDSIFTNTGGSTTANTASSGTTSINRCEFRNPLTTSSTNVLGLGYTNISTSAQNVISLTAGGTSGNIFLCEFSSGSASAISISGNFTLLNNIISSTNSIAVTGAGTVSHTGNDYATTGVINNVTTQTISKTDPIFTSGIGIGSTPGVTNGLTFDGTNFINNYAIGTWTPTVVGQSVAGTTTYTNQIGYYTRIGNLVMIQGLVTASAATGTGNVLFGGLPFTIKNQTGGSPYGAIISSSGVGLTWPAGTTMLTLQGITSSTTANIFASGSASGGGNLQMANTALNFQFTLIYQI